MKRSASTRDAIVHSIDSINSAESQTLSHTTCTFLNWRDYAWIAHHPNSRKLARLESKLPQQAPLLQPIMHVNAVALSDEFVSCQSKLIQGPIPQICISLGKDPAHMLTFDSFPKQISDQHTVSAPYILYYCQPSIAYTEYTLRYCYVRRISVQACTTMHVNHAWIRHF